MTVVNVCAGIGEEKKNRPKNQQPNPCFMCLVTFGEDCTQGGDWAEAVTHHNQPPGPGGLAMGDAEQTGI